MPSPSRPGTRNTSSQATSQPDDAQLGQSSDEDPQQATQVHAVTETPSQHSSRRASSSARGQSSGGTVAAPTRSILNPAAPEFVPTGVTNIATSASPLGSDASTIRPTIAQTAPPADLQSSDYEHLAEQLDKIISGREQKQNPRERIDMLQVLKKQLTERHQNLSALIQRLSSQLEAERMGRGSNSYDVIATLQGHADAATARLAWIQNQYLAVDSAVEEAFGELAGQSLQQ